VNILVLNGGGSKGLASARFMQQFEQILGPVTQHFDLVCGVSTGAILGTMLAAGDSAFSVCEHYEDMLPQVFPQRGWRLWRGVTRPKYPAEPLEARLEDIWSDTRLGHLELDTMVLATQLSPELKPKVWKSWVPEDREVLVRHTVRASSAAPTYFAPHVVDGAAFVDGGLCTNEPSMCALAEAVRRTGTVAQHHVLTIRPSHHKGFDLAHARRKVSPLGWVPDIIDVLMQSGERVAEYQSHSLIGFANHVVDLGLEGDLDQTGPEHNQRCLEAAIKAWQVHQPALKKQFGPA
jgi:patatin-like phospholipase/acyl hydrolase